ncbi:MAG: DUF4382 domain-containing protein [Myxococcales bacterium]|nr:DUF4382 domain-containing protein [Myxococcales bacterium]MCB9731950.1 DUF4382 domain-containing protein [Deltaproteobacteria bacterium]
MKTRSTWIPLLLLAATPLAAACSDSTSGSTDGQGKVTLKLTDAPGDDIAAAVVTISEVYLVGDGVPRVTLMNHTVVTDLVSLHNDTELLVGDAIVPNGRYSQLRLVITGAYVQTTSGDIYATAGYDQVPAGATVMGNLKTPSWDTSGLKVKLGAGQLAVAGDQHVLVVDFDVAESFQTETGNGDWVMHPVVTATEIGLTGTIIVDVGLAAGVLATAAQLADVEVVLVDAGGHFEGALPLADVDGDGRYEASFYFVTPSEGPFEVSLRATNDLAVVTDAPSQTIALGSGSEASVGFTIQSLTP